MEVNLKTSKIIVENIQVKKQDGSKANIRLQPSNLQIIELADRKMKKKEETETTKNEKPKDETIKSEEKKEIKKSKSKINPENKK